jgi:hypothetical protein
LEQRAASNATVTPPEGAASTTVFE